MSDYRKAAAVQALRSFGRSTPGRCVNDTTAAGLGGAAAAKRIRDNTRTLAELAGTTSARAGSGSTQTDVTTSKQRAAAALANSHTYLTEQQSAEVSRLFGRG